MTTRPADATAALAGHGRRLGATLLDGLAYVLFVGAFSAAGFVVGLMGGSGSDNADDGWERLGWILLGLIGIFAATAVWYGPAVFGDERRGLHDGMLGTRVVDAKPGAGAPAPDALWPAMP